MANNCQVAKDIKCRTCSASGHIAAACLPTASIPAVEGENTGNLALEYQPKRPQQQQQQQNKQPAQVNYVQSYPSLQAVYPNRETGRYYSLGQGNTANINAVSTTVTKNRSKKSEKKERSRAAADHEEFVNKHTQATAAYSEAQTRAIHNKPTPPLLW